jgi:hypothetical protein
VAVALGLGLVVVVVVVVVVGLNGYDFRRVCRMEADKK